MEIKKVTGRRERERALYKETEEKKNGRERRESCLSD